MPHGINGSNDHKHSLIDETCGCTTEKNLLIMAGIGDYGKLATNFINPNLIGNCTVHFNENIFGNRNYYGVLDNDQAVICGTLHGICFTPESLKSENPQPIGNLDTLRNNAGHIVVNNSLLWITGGYTPKMGKWSATTEFFSLENSFQDSQVQEGPDLPKKLESHCMLEIDHDQIMITGGLDMTDGLKDLARPISHYSAKATSNTFVYDFLKSEWSPGPSMGTSRYNHGCATIKFSDLKAHIVAGGISNSKSTLASVELLLSEPNAPMSIWIIGKYNFF